MERLEQPVDEAIKQSPGTGPKDTVKLGSKLKIWPTGTVLLRKTKTASGNKKPVLEHASSAKVCTIDDAPIPPQDALHMRNSQMSARMAISDGCVLMARLK